MRVQEISQGNVTEQVTEDGASVNAPADHGRTLAQQFTAVPIGGRREFPSLALPRQLARSAKTRRLVQSRPTANSTRALPGRDRASDTPEGIALTRRRSGIAADYHAARRNPSTSCSHASSWFQLVKMRLTTNP